MAVFVNQDFNGQTDGTNLSTLSGWSKRSSETGDLLVSTAGRVYLGSLGWTPTCYLHSGTPGGADYDVEATFRCLSVLDDSYPTIFARAASGSRAAYGLQYRTYNGTWNIVKFGPSHASNSGGTVLGTPYSQSLSSSTSYAVKLELRGTTIKAYIDSVERISTTDSDLSDAGQVGLFTFGNPADSTTTGIHIDNLVATDAVVADTTPPTLSSRATNTAGTAITATLSEADCTPSSGSGGFTLGGTSATVASWAISGTTLTLTLSGTVAYGETVTLTYSRSSTTDDIADAATNYLADFSAAAVTNNVPEPLVAGTASFAHSGPGVIRVTATAPTGGSGAGPTYQWFRSDDGAPRAAISGATTLTHDDTGVSPGVTYEYEIDQTKGTDTVTAAVPDPVEVYEGGVIGGPPPGEVDDVTAQEIIDAIVADVAAIVGHIAATNVALPSGVTMGDFDPLTDGLRAANTAGEAAMDLIGTPDGASLAADIAAVKGDTEDIKAKTDALPADPVGVADLPDVSGLATQAALDLVASDVTDIAGYVDSEAAATLAAVQPAAIRAALGLGAADLDTQLGDLQTAVDAIDTTGGGEAAYSSTLATVTSTGGTLNSPPAYSLAGYVLTVGGRTYEVATHTAGAAAFTLAENWKVNPTAGDAVMADYLPSRATARAELLAATVPMRNLTAVTAPTVGDGLAAAAALAAGDETVSGTAYVRKHLDGTTARTFTLDDADAPTSRT
jgi:hypothetical protein